MEAPRPPTERLQRLLAYLWEDPRNDALLAEAFDAAMACGEAEQAAAFLQSAVQAEPGSAAWRRRDACVRILRRDLEGAAAILQTLLDDPGAVHDLGYVRLLQGDAVGCQALIARWMGPDAPSSSPESGRDLEAALQLLWVRSEQHLGRRQEVRAWALERAAAHRLHAAAQGAVSLTALDLGDFEAARAWSRGALEAGAEVPEALVAAACVAVAEGATAHARALLNRALKCNPLDGRIWSTLGITSLQAGDLPLAQAELEKAVSFMAGHVGTWLALGWARLLRGAPVEAEAAFATALELNRNFAESHGAVALALVLRDRRPEAVRHLDVADRLDPRNVTARYARAVLAGEVTDAASLRRLAVRLLERPGFFGGKLSDAFTRSDEAAKQPT